MVELCWLIERKRKTGPCRRNGATVAAVATIAASVGVRLVESIEYSNSYRTVDPVDDDEGVIHNEQGKTGEGAAPGHFRRGEIARDECETGHDHEQEDCFVAIKSRWNRLLEVDEQSMVPDNVCYEHCLDLCR